MWNCQLLRIAVFFAVLAGFGFPCAPSLVAAIQSDGESEEAVPQASDDDNLPEHALWRYGKWGENVGLNGFYRMVFSPDGRMLVARNAMNEVLLFDVQQRKLLFEFKSYEDRQKVANFDFTPDSRYFLTAAEGYMEKISVWDTQTGKLYRELETDGKAAYFDGSERICVLKPREIRYYDLESGQLLRTEDWGDSGDSPITFSRSGDRVMAQRKIRRLAYKTQIIDVARKTTTILDSPTVVARAGIVSPDGNWLAAVFNRQKEGFLWDLRDPHQKDKHKLVAHSQTVQSVQFSPDSRFLATTGWDKDVYLWDVLTRQKIGKLSGHMAHVNSCAFSTEPFLLATGASGKADNSILFWNFRDLVFPPAEMKSESKPFDEVWNGLASDNHRTALDAVEQLVRFPDLFLDPLSEKLGVDAHGASVEDFRRWIEQLASPRFAQRVEAEELLKKYRMRAEPTLKDTLSQKGLVLEVKYRIMRILTQPIERPKIPTEEQHRLHRAIFALELIGSEKAKTSLQEIAESHSHVDIARDAASSMERLKASQSR